MMDNRVGNSRYSSSSSDSETSTTSEHHPMLLDNRSELGHSSGESQGFGMADSKKNLIVNYLPQTFTDKALFDIFVTYGALHSVKIMREAKSGYSYGYGFVNFFREEDAALALEVVNGRVVENKRLKVSIARPPSDDIKDTNVYITNLPKWINDEKLVDLFQQFGDIVQRNLLLDKSTHIPRGSAFVRFDRREQASKAILNMNNRVLEGSSEPIRVKLAQDHGKQKAAYLAGFQDALQKKPPPKCLLFK